MLNGENIENMVAAEECKMHLQSAQNFGLVKISKIDVIHISSKWKLRCFYPGALQYKNGVKNFNGESYLKEFRTRTNAHIYADYDGKIMECK